MTKFQVQNQCPRLVPGPSLNARSEIHPRFRGLGLRSKTQFKGPCLNPGPRSNSYSHQNAGSTSRTMSMFRSKIQVQGSGPQPWSRIEYQVQVPRLRIMSKSRSELQDQGKCHGPRFKSKIQVHNQRQNLRFWVLEKSKAKIEILCPI